MIAVKAVQHEGDWYLIPIEMYQEFLNLIEELHDLEYDYDRPLKCLKRIVEQKLKKFDKYKTGEDLNLIQLYIEEK